MATLLYRIGHYSYRHAWTVIGVWALLLLGILGGGFALGGQTQESFAIPGTESQDAIDHLAAVFPQAAGASAQIVYQAPDGSSIRSQQYESAIDQAATRLENIDGVSSVLTPFSEYASDAISANNRSAITTVQLDETSSEVSDETLAGLKATASVAEDAGLRVEFGGQVFQDTTFGITITEALGVIFAAVVLIITFGSLIAAGMPLISALIGVGITMGIVTGASAFMTISSASPLLALMLGLAVGIDYSLFILSRHRQQLAQGLDPEESAAISVATAGSAVIFAGVTVIIALLGLLVVGIPFLSVMGVAAALAVLIAMLVAVTLLPAMLGLARKRLVPKLGSRAHRRAHERQSAKPALGTRWVRAVMKAPIVAVAAVVVILGTLAIPALSLDLNLPDGGSEPVGSTQRAAYDLISEDFGPGYNGPLVVAVDITQTTDIQNDLASISADLRQVDDVAYVSQGIPNPTLDTAIIQVIPNSGPDSPETKQLVDSIRDLSPAIADEYGTPIRVTGSTAVAVDISNRLAGALIPFALVVVGLSIILLMMVFRSVFVPIKAAVGFLLSISAATGVVVAIFQWGWFADFLNIGTPGPILSFLPIIMMALLFGLAMDYEVFLVSGMREEFVKTNDAKGSIEHGFSNAARVVTAAALIMFFVFFAFVPEGSGVIKGIALGLAVGIFFDAFLVRMTLVPAAMALAGKAAWWLPGWLSRILPNVDIEGERLQHHLTDRKWANGQVTSITAEDLVTGLPGMSVGPVSFAVPQGGILFVTGDNARRNMLTATLGGRLDPLSGQLQVGGLPLPTEKSKVLCLVALAGETGSDARGQEKTVGEALAERLEFGLPWFKTAPSKKQLAAWLDRINQALTSEHRAPGSMISITAATSLASLSALERATCLTAAALTENPRVVVVDVGIGFSDGINEAGSLEQFAAVISALAPTDTTIIIGLAQTPDTALPTQLVAGRPATGCHLDSIEREGVLL